MREACVPRNRLRIILKLRSNVKQKKTKTPAESKSINPNQEKIKPPRIESAPLKVWKDENDQNQWVSKEKTDDKNNLFKEVMGVKDSELSQIILAAAASSTFSLIGLTESLNMIIQSLHDFKPKDAIEARLAAQTAVTFQHGMSRLTKSGTSENISISEAQVNMAIKLLRVHNETVEALNRYRRGGEQKVTVTHIAEKMAVVNHFVAQETGGDTQENKGESPCQKSAEQKPEQTTITNVDSHQWLMGDADFMAGKALAQRQKKVCEKLKKPT